MPAALVLLSPWTDLTLAADSIDRLADVDPTVTRLKLTHSSNFYLQGADARDPRASPLFADLRGMPPTLIQVGTVELLLDDSLRTAEKMLRAGATVRMETYVGAAHLFQLHSASRPDARKAIDAIGRFVRAEAAVARRSP